MNINDKIDLLISEEKVLNESGIRNIKELAKKYKEAKILYHQDLDGITSAVGMKYYLKGYGIKTIDAQMIQYGDLEYTVKKTPKGVMQVVVDFGHNKISSQIWTDHHDHDDAERREVTKGQSKSLPKTPSNAEAISMTISPTDIFPPKDIKIISMVDTAGFAPLGLTPEDVMVSVFSPDPDIDVTKNHMAMGLVVNKLLLAYKNKPKFLDEVVMTAGPSLISLYNTTVTLAKKYGFHNGKEMKELTANYKDQRTKKVIKDLKLSDIPNMKGGDSGMIGTTIVQTGGGAMIPARGNQYDRYTIFAVHPDADYLVTEWPSMLNQMSKNPFVSKRSPVHLGDIMMKKIMPKYKGKLTSMKVTLDTLKYNFEAASMRKKGIDGIVGFTWADLQYLFDPQLKKIATSKQWYQDMMHDIVNKPYKSLSFKQKAQLKKIEISAWDLIMKQSGGHKDITNITLPSWLGKKGEMKKIQRDITVDMAKEMSTKKLV